MESKRRAERRPVDYSAKVYIAGSSIPLSIRIKDLSSTGMRVVIAGRVVKKDTDLRIELELKDGLIKCEGIIKWVLTLSLGLGNLPLFDVGIEFLKLSSEDSVFLKDFVEHLNGNGKDIR